MLQQYLTLNAVVFLLVFARVGSAFLVLPGFSAIYVPEQVRLLIALLFSFVLMPVVADTLAEVPRSPGGMVLLLVQEVTVGLFLGGLGRVLLAALQTTGTVVALFSSLANAFVNDPVAEQQSSVFSGFLVMLGMIAVFASDAHHLMIRAVADSYALFVPGAGLPFGDFSDFFARTVSESFGIGVRMSAPFIVAGIAYYVGLGILGRLMPQLPVFFFGLPVQVVAQLMVFILALTGIMLVFLNTFSAGYRPFLAP